VRSRSLPFSWLREAMTRPKASRDTSPPSVDLSSRMLYVQDQGLLRGTCLAFAVTASHELSRSPEIGPLEDLSEEMLYWGAKQVEGNHRSGAQCQSMDAALTRWGQPLESLWPYDPLIDDTQSTYQPPAACLQPGNARKARLQKIAVSVESFRSELGSGRAVVTGIPLWDAFLRPVNGQLTNPDPTDLTSARHAVVTVGYDDGRSRILVRNSWGETWGDRGHAWLPYAFVSQHVIEAWVIER
jgi:C1A family cysteine protease